MKTCCCYDQEEEEEPSCCDSGQHYTDKKTAKESPGGLPGLYTAPCGDGVRFLEPSAAKIDLCLPEASPVAAMTWRVQYYPASLDSPHERFMDPPDPPPKVFAGV
jgi:hypothetical protein